MYSSQTNKKITQSKEAQHHECKQVETIDSKNRPAHFRHQNITSNMFKISDVLKAADASSPEPMVSISSQLHVQQYHVGSLRLAVGGVFAPEKLANTIN